MRMFCCFLVVLVLGCGEEPRLSVGTQSVTAADAPPTSGDAPLTSGDCYDDACWTLPWGWFEPPDPDQLPYENMPEDIGDPGDAGAGSGSDAGGYDAGGYDAGVYDACAIDAPGDAPTDAPTDAPCAAEPEPQCPQPPPGGYQPQNPGIPGGGQCRGACGSACPKTCVAKPPVSACVSWRTADCKVHAKTCTYQVKSCGSHAGCRTHDTCYDGCANKTGVAYWLCRRGCDDQCIRKWGAATCASWMRGGGPYDKWLDFTGAPGSATQDGACP